MAEARIVFSIHALKRMFERSISRVHVLHVMRTGEVIKEYPHDRPYPSRLVLGWWENHPLHIVVGLDKEKQTSVIITVYGPDPDEWELDYRRKKR